MKTPDDAADGLSVLHGERVLLRRVRERDKQVRLAAGRDAEAVRMYGGDERNPAPFTAEDAERRYAFQRRQPYAWVIEVEGRCVGGVSLNAVNLRERRATLAIGIHDAGLRNRGIGTEATRLVLGYAFEQLGLHRVGLRVLEYNHRAIACYEKCGFVREGVERETAFVGGRWYSDLMMGILEQEYRVLCRTWDRP